MKFKYCFECEKSKDNKLHHWVRTKNGCVCKNCGLESDSKEDAAEIMGKFA